MIFHILFFFTGAAVGTSAIVGFSDGGRESGKRLGEAAEGEDEEEEGRTDGEGDDGDLVE